MGGFSAMQWLVLANGMGDLVKGLKAFRRGMAEGEATVAPTRLEAPVER